MNLFVFRRPSLFFIVFPCLSLFLPVSHFIFFSFFCVSMFVIVSQSFSLFFSASSCQDKIRSYCFSLFFFASVFFAFPPFSMLFCFSGSSAEMSRISWCNGFNVGSEFIATADGAASFSPQRFSLQERLSNSLQCSSY